MNRIPFNLPPTQEPFRARGLARRDAPRPLKVFKFGSSVLRTPADLPRVAGELYRHTRHGERVIAIVSAFEGETDALVSACALASGTTDCGGIAEAVSLGEEKTAALLRIACDRIGLKARTVRPELFGIWTEGPVLEASPVGLNGNFRQLGEAPVLILPGFVGIDTSGTRSLLGRGGSDFSAIILGAELKADCIRLYKDVDGVFDHDPASDGPALRFDEVSFDDCLAFARPLLQPRAVEYAAKRELALEVSALPAARPTCVGSRSAPPRPLEAMAPLRIGLAGFGMVGQALASRIEEEAGFEIAAILVRDTAKDRPRPPPVALTADPKRFVAEPIDVLVDLTACEATGQALSAVMLERGIPVVSTNLRVLGTHLGKLERLAAEHGSTLLYSGAIGGSAPLLETLRLAFTWSEVVAVDAVLNSTVNMLLHEVGEGRSPSDALERACAAGLAYGDAERDLSGADAEAKLRLLGAQLIGSERRIPISIEALDGIRLQAIAESRQRWVQHSGLRIWKGGLTGFVRIRPVRDVRTLIAPKTEQNVICVTTADARRFRASGRGAGAAPAAEAVLADLVDIWTARQPSRSPERKS